ncbi:DUF134 domain-containing protein [bacterium]|nr:DUF134 domain-containing protein [bacterium]
MPRPRFCRNVAGKPQFQRFKSAGIPAQSLPEVVLTLDEYEALRLADCLGLYQEKAAQHMNVSRQTFGRILEAAHKKTAKVIVEGGCLNIEGGPVAIRGKRQFACRPCEHVWEVPFGTPRPGQCPQCGKTAVRRVHTENRKGLWAGYVPEKEEKEE